MLRKIIGAITVLLSVVQATAANTINDKQEKLTHIQQSISDVKVQLSHQQQLRKDHQKQLKNTEIKIAKLLNQLATTQKNLDLEQKKLQQLDSKKKHYQRLITQQKAGIAQQLRAAYLLPDDSVLKLLLDAQQSSDVARMRQYYYYLTKIQIEKIQQFKKNITLLKDYEKKSQQQEKRLLDLRKKQQQQHAKLKKLKQSRQHIVASINGKILTKQQRLSLLNEQKHQLEQTILSLQKRKSHLKRHYFDHLKGKLAWPLKGVLLTHYGDSIKQSELTSSGVLIRAKPDQSVHAIANGKVIFANWLSGYGLLLIVEHGDGYMSLYGRNQNLYKKVGDKVKQGETISRVGESGGYEKPELYFAIRHNAKPQNPAIWCR